MKRLPSPSAAGSKPVRAGMVGRAVLCPPLLSSNAQQLHPDGAHGVTRPTAPIFPGTFIFNGPTEDAAPTGLDLFVGGDSTNMPRLRRWLLLCFCLLPSAFCLPAFAQTYSVDWLKVAGGGGTSTGGVYTATVTFGQADAGGPMQGGGYSFEGGFWSLYAVQSSSVTGNAPVITSPPQAVLATNVNGVAFSVAATGTPPLFYQWQQNGTNLTDGGIISGSTTSNLTLNALWFNNEGNYSVVIENAYGSVTSSVASLTLILPAYYVTNNSDSGPGTLRQAIANAANAPAPPVITFAPNLSGQTILLTTSTLTINTNLTIDASALPGGIQINGQGRVQIFYVAYGNIVVLNWLTMTNGDGNDDDGEGGGIYNEGTMTVNQCTLSGNSASDGGGIYNNGTLTVNQCTLSGNSGGFGGGILNDGTLTVNQSTLSGNNGGDGGGICNYGTLTVNQSTLSGNSAYVGGGIFSHGTLTVNQCTLSGNNASDAGGGVYNLGTAMVNQSTLSGNSGGSDGGGGIFNSGPLAIANSIIAGNSAGVGADIFNTSHLIYGDSNIIQLVDYNGGDINGPVPINAAPNLAPLGNYGGPTQTMPPLPGSPAIGAGSVAGNIFTTDQRGYPRTQNGLMDIGAVELPTIQFTASPTNAPVGASVQFTGPGVDSDGSAVTQWSWSFNDGATSTAQNPTHVYSSGGIFTATLIVTNSLGLTLSNSGPAITVIGNALVTTTNDSGIGSLRQAINDAYGGETIIFATNLSGKIILLTSGTLTIDTSLTIDASALTNGITINGNHSVGVFNVVFGTTNVLTSLTIINGNSNTGGAGIYNNGTLTINQCTLSGNVTTGFEADGAGIYNAGTLVLNQCTVSGNNVSAANGFGGGVYNTGAMAVNQSTLSGNSASLGGGGGIYNSDTLTVNQCTLSENSAYDGGGIFNDGTLSVNQSTLTGNSAEYGGGIINYDTLSVNQSTLTGNSASYDGGGIFNNYSMNGILTEFNSIVAGNSADSGADIYNNTIYIFGGSNIVQSVYNAYVIAGTTPISAAPNLAPLGNYGGPTQTMPPLPGSPAIGAGSVAGNTFTNDQRGYPRIQNGLIDIGAVELPTLQFTASPTNAPVGASVQFNGPGVDSDGSAVTQWSWSFNDNATSTAQNPTHIYSSGGIFTATLIVTNSLGLTLAASGPAINTYILTVQYTASPTNGYAPLTVQFNCAGLDSSNNVIARWHWNFGDNTTASTNQSPAHVYGSVGGYAPIVIVTNNLGFAIYASGPAISVVPHPASKAARCPKPICSSPAPTGLRA